MTQESGHSFLGLLLRNSHGLHKVLAGDAVISRLTWAWIYFQAHLGGCWQDLGFHGLLDQGPQFLSGYCPKTSLSSWLCGPLSKAAYNMAATFIRMKTLRDKEEGGVTVLYNLHIKWHPIIFCCILFTRNQSLGPAHTQGEDYTKMWVLGGEDRWGHLIGPHSTVCLRYFIVSFKRKNTFTGKM